MSARWWVGALFAVLVVALGVGLWGTVVHPPAYEVRGVLVARVAPGMILVRHDAVAGLGMDRMELMAVIADPDLLDRAGVKPGDAVRLAVKPHGDDVRLLRIEKQRE